MSQLALRTRPLVLRKPSCRPSDCTVALLRVEYCRISGYSCAAATSRARSCAVETFAEDRPVGSTKRVSFMPSAAALAFIAATNTPAPSGKVRPSEAAARFSEDISASSSRSSRVSTVPGRRRERVPLTAS